VLQNIERIMRKTVAIGRQRHRPTHIFWMFVMVLHSFGRGPVRLLPLRFLQRVMRAVIIEKNRGTRDAIFFFFIRI